MGNKASFCCYKLSRCEEYSNSKSSRASERYKSSSCEEYSNSKSRRALERYKSSHCKEENKPHEEYSNSKSSRGSERGEEEENKPHDRSSDRISNLPEEEENKPHDQNSDRISNLPDAILHQRLFLLPFKTIAQTCVLTTRWSYLWASYPVLDFSEVFPMPYPKYLVNETILDQQTKAMKFITTVLSSCHENSNIKVFRVAGHLSCSGLYDFIGRVVKHRVEELSLEIWPSDNCDVPCCLTGCDSLRSLKLETGAQNFGLIPRPILLKLSSNSGLRSLHTLSLTGVHFSDSALVDVDLFTSSSFPSLERLTVEKCTNMSHDLIVSSTNLKDVQISGIAINTLDICGTRLENLKIQFCRARSDNAISWIKVFAPNLRTLDWDGNKIIEKILIDIFPVLTTSSLWLHRIGGYQVNLGRETEAKMFNNTVNNLISASSQVQKLILCGGLEELSNIYSGGGLRYSFINLETVHNYTSLGKCQIPGIASLLKSSPVVHSLILDIWSRQFDRWNNTLLDNTGTEEQYAKSSSKFQCLLMSPEGGED